MSNARVRGLVEEKVLDHGHVRLMDYMGTDMTIVNAARVSFSKHSEFKCTEHHADIGHRYGLCPNCYLADDDKKLIRYLIDKNHWTPLGHPQLQFCIRLPIFVARQWMRSNVGIVFNEESRRYIDVPPEFHMPDVWRKRPEKRIKQGSGENITDPDVHHKVATAYEELVRCSNNFYDMALNEGVAPEMARFGLLVSTYTEFWMTCSLAAAARIVKLRVAGDAQREIQDYGQAMSRQVQQYFPYSWAHLMRSETPVVPLSSSAVQANAQIVDIPHPAD